MTRTSTSSQWCIVLKHFIALGLGMAASAFGIDSKKLKDGIGRMAAICLDIGNTGSHYGLVEGALTPGEKPKVVWRGDLETSRIEDGLPAVLEKARYHGADFLAFSTVVPKVLPLVVKLGEAHGLKIFQLTWKTCVGMPLHVDEPDKVGQDRLASAIAAQSWFPLPAIVLDMGTAVTCDLVSFSGYEGGLIAPGLGIMTDYMHQRTAQLPKLDASDLSTPPGMGRNTIDQMKQGTAAGFAGMIDGLLLFTEEVLRTSNRQASSIIATGGTAKFLPERIRARLLEEQDLNLLGLHEALRRWRDA